MLLALSLRFLPPRWKPVVLYLRFSKSLAQIYESAYSPIFFFFFLRLFHSFLEVSHFTL